MIRLQTHVIDVPSVGAAAITFCLFMSAVAVGAAVRRHVTGGIQRGN